MGVTTADLEVVVRARQSVRSFVSESIDVSLVHEAIELAGWAPSPHGTQPWRFVIMDCEADRVALSAAMAGTWREQLLLDNQESEVIERRVQLSRDRIERTPVVVILCLYLGDAHVYPDDARQKAEFLMAVQSLGAAAQNFLLGLEARGLASGWMCAPLFCPEVIRDTLGLPAALEPHAMFPIGHMASPPKRRPRRPASGLVVPVNRP